MSLATALIRSQRGIDTVDDVDVAFIDHVLAVAGIEDVRELLKGNLIIGNGRVAGGTKGTTLLIRNPVLGSCWTHNPLSTGRPHVELSPPALQDPTQRKVLCRKLGRFACIVKLRQQLPLGWR